jgi:hypothetical protein
LEHPVKTVYSFMMALCCALFPASVLLAATKQADRTELKAHYLWAVHAVDDLNSSMRYYRRFAMEGDLARNVLVLHCRLDPEKRVYAEFIPPKFLLSRLEALTSNTSTAGNVEVAGESSSFTRKGEIDGKAAFMDFDDNEIVKAVTLLGESSTSFRFFEDNLSYKITSDMASSKAVAAIFSQPNAKQKFGETRFISSGEVAADCLQRRKADTKPAPQIPLIKSLTPDEVAMVLGTLVVQQQFCPLKTNDFPLNIAVAALGQDLVDFMPGNRYEPLVEVKRKKAVEYMQIGKDKACPGMEEILLKNLPNVFR